MDNQEKKSNKSNLWMPADIQLRKISSGWVTLGASNHTDKIRQAEDWYATDSIAIDKLLSVFQPHHDIWESACSDGILSERLKQLGYSVLSTDLIDRNYPEENNQSVNFFDCTEICSGDILTNPPYKYAKEFVLHGLDLVKNGNYVIMFLRLQFLESISRKNEIFDKFPPKFVFVFSERIQCAKNAEFQKMKDGGGSAVAYAWFVWEKGFVGDTIIKWL